MTHHDATRFYELKHSRQRADEPRRKWFTTTRQDLLVWFDDNEAITAFRLTYEWDGKLFSLHWDAETAFVHSNIDTGDRGGGWSKSSLLTRTKLPPKADLADQFRVQANDIDPRVRDFVAAKLSSLPDGIGD